MHIDGHSPLLTDLHCHSTASDGGLSPASVVARASENGVGVLALTDHDTIAGMGEAREAAVADGMHLVSGVELSCLWRGQTIHVVALDFDPDEPGFLQVLEGQESVRHQRAGTIDERLRKQGLPSVLEQARDLAAGVPGRPHFARALVDAGVVPGERQAFQRYLGTGKVGDVATCWPELAVVVGWIREAGGIPVLAHPRRYGLTNNKLRKLVQAFLDAGGQALEVLSAGHSPQDSGYLTRLCLDGGLWASGGSDFHWPERPWSELGRLPELPAGPDPVWRHFRRETQARLQGE
ncbi:PHP domain-containing protein [Halospina sp. K52047b]|uniref:PHP domain-containing protein n=1 Tax=Halospina sp. K52047b TaxID=2614160 RepID=UPI001249C120|nr:PHP domain-containing protein [Halospina sp. K52047b]KAA8984334.1 PHP domain-containing protein [Halospina sp. K52047b]